MAVRLIKKGREVQAFKLEGTGPGWVNLFVPKGGVYPITGGGVYAVTVTADKCKGLRITDWDASSGFRTWETTAMYDRASMSMVLDVTNRLVVRALDPAEDFSGHILVEKVSPPCLRKFGRLVKAVARWA